MSKREKRIALQQARLQKQQQKSARLRDQPAMQHAVRAAMPGFDAKSARRAKNPGSIMSLQMQWAKDHCDTEGYWSWGQARQWSDDDWNGNIHPNLSELSRLTWAEIHSQTTDKGHRKHHDMDVGVLADEACERWLEREIDTDTAFRFRFANKPRLWGFRVKEVFSVVWWDPEHKIYPIDPS